MAAPKEWERFSQVGIHAVILELEKVAMEEDITKENMKEKRDDLVKNVN